MREGFSKEHREVFWLLQHAFRDFKHISLSKCKSILFCCSECLLPILNLLFVAISFSEVQ